MHVTIRLFARLREIAGTADLARELQDGGTARDAWQSLTREYRELSAYDGLIACAVNEEYARLNQVLKDGDDVAFLPPVSGG